MPKTLRAAASTAHRRETTTGIEVYELVVTDLACAVKKLKLRLEPHRERTGPCLVGSKDLIANRYLLAEGAN